MVYGVIASSLDSELVIDALTIGAFVIGSGCVIFVCVMLFLSRFTKLITEEVLSFGIFALFSVVLGTVTGVSIFGFSVVLYAVLLFSALLGFIAAIGVGILTSTIATSVVVLFARIHRLAFGLEKEEKK